MSSSENTAKFYIAYFIGIYFFVTAIYAIFSTVTSSETHAFHVTFETLVYQAFRMLAGVFLLLRKELAIYLFILVFCIHVAFRAWWLFLGGSETSYLQKWSYLVVLLLFYSALVYYLARLRVWGYYVRTKIA